MANHFVDVVLGAGAGSAPVLETDDGQQLDYAGLRHRIEAMTGALLALGVAPGDRVAAQIEKSTEGLILYFATVAAGGVFLPLNTAYTPAELDYFLHDAEPSLVVCDPAQQAAIAALAGPAQIVTLDARGEGSLRAAARDAGPASAQDRGPDDLAAILYTSGTTGRSKGAMLTHDNLVSNARALVSAWRMTPEDVLLHALPIYHTHGLFVACNTILLAGARMIFMARFDAARMLAAMPRATMMMGVPTFYTRLLDHDDLTRDVTGGMRLFVSGSAPLLPETHRAFAERTGHVILERYGMTETNMNTSNPYDGERRPGTVGFPLPDVDVRVVDPESGQRLAREEIGMIEVRGPNVFKGYWRNPEKTAAEFRADGFFITGDLGKIDVDGYIHIVGRGKDLVISGGFNVYPKEVEVEIDSIEGVIESAVIGLPHKDFGEGVAAIVVRRPGVALDEAAIRGALENRLAKFKQPKRVIFVEDLPRNTMGKVQKNVLRDTFKDTFVG